MSPKTTRRTYVIRHNSRNKRHEVDPQTPTFMGFIESLVMGLLLAKDYSVKAFTRVVSSPQPRGTRTAKLIQVAISLFWSKGDVVTEMTPIETHEGLNDFSSDERFAALKKAFKVIKGMGAAVESEQAIFMAGPDSELEALRVSKLEGAVAVIDGIEDEGDILVGGLHGATIDGLFAHYATLIDPKVTANGMSVFGRQIDKCEGFVLSYEGDALKSIRKIERPAWLNALSALKIG